ncbi:sigma-70 family RNA polymerase sigma factor [Saccharothrix sp. S26]|uniref:sigma-70 family RNA polymerase sigma factor n=1 Tax=Saccharothrix sp. S26 TaxID=2907215 RepID=UPI001F45766A|nr:sigma-70 family RNA polymerase sigma factor [Saccharothrix sp. S26]MCE6999371.1 sigma-70 family RNA polymerase sigma factor [Saccharothrix sp. S26]
MATVPAEVQGPSDAELIDSVRGGDVDAYGQLYERHVTAAYNLARQLARSSAEADDLVSDAFAKVLDALRAGRGPDSAFRAYLLTALRHTAYDKTRRDRKVELSDDVAEAAPEATSVPFSDTAVAGLERSMAAKAFARLPERWQTVLWHTEIEGQTPAEVAPLLGLTANGVSALAYRAREGLKQAYLQVHLAETQAERCRATVDRLGAWTRGGLSKRETTQVEAHLDECTRCRALAAELADVNGALRGIIAPLVLGLGATGYLAAAGAGTAKAAAVAAAAGTGGAAGAAASAPRQFLVAAASTAALVVAVAIGLASGGEQQVPAAQAAPPPTTQPAQPVQPPAPVVPPPPPVPSPEPAPTTEPASVPTPAPVPTPAAEPAPEPEPAPQPEPEPQPEPQPQPSPPSLVPVVPSGFSLTPGEEPVELPITVRNSGETPSEPASAALVLPPGVRSAGPVASLAGGRLLRLDGAADQTVACPAGTGAVTCATTQGIAPGGTATFVFRLQADPDAATGRITGIVNAGTSVSVAIDVAVEVRPVHDDLDLQVHRWQHGFWDPRLDIKATNTGGRAGVLRLVVESDRHITLVALRPDCERSWHRVVCEVPLERGESFRMSVWAVGAPHREGVVRVSATLGAASESVEVPISTRPGGGDPHEPEPPVVTTTPAPPTTTTPTTTTKRSTPPTTTTTPPTTTTAPPASTTTPSTPSTAPTTTTTPTTEPTTAPTTTTPPPTRGEPCRPRPPWLPPILDDLRPGRCDTPS